LTFHIGYGWRYATVKKFVIGTMILLLSAGVVSAKAYEVKKKAGDYSVELAMDKSAVKGKNELGITVKDAGGNYVTDAKVIANYSMPAMSGMPAMNYNAEAQLRGKTYYLMLDFPMSGSWNLTIKITHRGKTASAKFTIDAR
jgi:hypothetical protein